MSKSSLRLPTGLIIASGLVVFGMYIAVTAPTLSHLLEGVGHGVRSLVRILAALDSGARRSSSGTDPGLGAAAVLRPCLFLGLRCLKKKKKKRGGTGRKRKSRMKSVVGEGQQKIETPAVCCAIYVTYSCHNYTWPHGFVDCIREIRKQGHVERTTLF